MQHFVERIMAFGIPSVTVKRFSPFIYALFLLVGLATHVGAATQAAMINSPQAQQMLQQLAPQQQAQVQEALSGGASDKPAEVKLDTRDMYVSKGSELPESAVAKSALEKLYESRALQNPQLTQLRNNTSFGDVFPEDMLGVKYVQFGYTVFSQSHILTASSAQGDESYILGPGDAITVYLWGKLEERMDLTLDNTGTVVLPKAGPLNLSGVAFRNSGKLIQQALSKHFVNFDIQVVLKQRRNITVYMLGKAAEPGSFQVPAGTRLTGLLYLARGPLKSGSLRKIQILRNNRVVRTVDLYDYLLSGDRRQDVLLENDDTVLVPPVGDTVLISGTVAQSGIYEMTPGDTLSDMVGFAAGLTWDHYYKRVQIFRVQTGEFQRVEDVIVQTPAELVEKTKQIKLRNGDMVVFHPVRRELRNVVTAVGNFAQTGHYQWTPTMTLSGLIAKAEGVLPHSLSRVDVYRYVTEDRTRLITLDYTKAEDRAFKLQEWDVVKSYSETSLSPSENVLIQGAVHHPGAYPLLEGMRIQDLLFMAKLDTVLRAPEVDVLRLQPSGDVTLISVALDSSGMASPNIMLHPSDDIRVKTLKNPKIRVTISGEVAFPGQFTLTDKSRITDILKRAGGITSEAYLPATIFTRAKLSDHESSGYEKVLQDEQKRLMYDQLQMTAFSDIDKQINEKILEARAGYIQQLQMFGRRNKGRMVIAMQTLVSEGPGSERDLLLEDGDVIVIPKKPDYIQVLGGVESPATYQYLKDRTSEGYISRAGGLTKYADKENIKIFRVDGTVSKFDQGIQPGDIVYVPENISVPFNWMIFTRSAVDVLKTVSDAVFSFLVIKGLVTGF
jgi:protein involved in polysaccharide export with SLBB domain